MRVRLWLGMCVAGGFVLLGDLCCWGICVAGGCVLLGDVFEAQTVRCQQLFLGSAVWVASVVGMAFPFLSTTPGTAGAKFSKEIWVVPEIRRN
jgi:hypothetical protein